MIRVFQNGVIPRFSMHVRQGQDERAHSGTAFVGVQHACLRNDEPGGEIAVKCFTVADEASPRERKVSLWIDIRHAGGCLTNGGRCVR